MTIQSSAWRFTTPNSNSCSNATAVWTSSPINISSLTGISLSYSSLTSGNSTIVASMTNGSLSGSSFTPDAGATTTQISFTINITQKKRYRTLDNVLLTGTLSCTDSDGDGVCDDDEVDGLYQQYGHATTIQRQPMMMALVPMRRAVITAPVRRMEREPWSQDQA